MPMCICFGRYSPGKSGIQSTKLDMLFQTSNLSQEALLKTDICNFPNYLKINQIVLGINIHPPMILFIVFSLWRLLSPTGGKRAKWRRQSRQLASSCFSVAVFSAGGWWAVQASWGCSQPSSPSPPTSLPAATSKSLPLPAQLSPNDVAQVSAFNSYFSFCLLPLMLNKVTQLSILETAWSRP